MGHPTPSRQESAAGDWGRAVCEHRPPPRHRRPHLPHAASPQVSRWQRAGLLVNIIIDML